MEPARLLSSWSGDPGSAHRASDLRRLPRAEVRSVVERYLDLGVRSSWRFVVTSPRRRRVDTRAG